MPAPIIRDFHADVGARRQTHVAVLRRLAQIHIARLHDDLPVAVGGHRSTAFSKTFVSACCTFASSNRATNNSRSNCVFHVILSPFALAKKIHAVGYHRVQIPLWRAVRFLLLTVLNTVSSFAISAACAADFSTSISECRHGCPASALSSRNDVVAENARQRGCMKYPATLSAPVAARTPVSA